MSSPGWVELEGKLIWQDEAGTQAGIEFINISAAAREEVQAWLTFGGSLKELRGTWDADQARLESQPASEETSTEAAIEIEEDGSLPAPYLAIPPQSQEVPVIASPPLQFPQPQQVPRQINEQPKQILPQIPELMKGEQIFDSHTNSDQVLPMYRAAAFAVALCLIFLSAWAGMHGYAIRNALGKVESLVSSKPPAQPPASNVNPPAPAARAVIPQSTPNPKPTSFPAAAQPARAQSTPQPALQSTPRTLALAAPQPNPQPKTQQTKAPLATPAPNPQPRAPASQAIKSSTINPAPPKPTPSTAKFALQLAAMKQEENANQLAQSLRSLKYPALVFKRPGDPFYRVIVGPYPSTQSARSAKAALEKQSYPSILQPWKP